MPKNQPEANIAAPKTLSVSDSPFARNYTVRLDGVIVATVHAATADSAFFAAYDAFSQPDGDWHFQSESAAFAFRRVVRDGRARLQQADRM